MSTALVRLAAASTSNVTTDTGIRQCTVYSSPDCAEANKTKSDRDAIGAIIVWFMPAEQTVLLELFPETQ